MSVFTNTPKSRADSDALGRYYTAPAVAGLLVEKLDVSAPRTLIDLGCGAGSLTLAALERWPELEVVTLDLDETVSELLRTRLAGRGRQHRHVQGDALRETLDATLNVAQGGADVAVCNPPFVRPVWDATYAQLMLEAGFAPDSHPAQSQVQADVLFLAQNLRLLANGGRLGFIAPASFVSGKPYRAFREALLAQHRVHAVVRLPRNAFAQADARAFILVIEKGSPTDGLIPVTSLSAGLVESAPRWIEPRAAAIRLDGGPAEEELALLPAAPAGEPQQTLADVTVSLVRGSFGPGPASAAAVPHPLFHTTDFPDLLNARAFAVPGHLHVKRPQGGITVAKRGDILIARVGRNLHRKVCLVSKGRAVPTDNVFRLCVQPGQSQRVFAALTSADGQAWLANVSYGVGARHVTKTDLLKFPLF